MLHDTPSIHTWWTGSRHMVSLVPIGIGRGQDSEARCLDLCYSTTRHVTLPPKMCRTIWGCISPGLKNLVVCTTPNCAAHRCRPLVPALRREMGSGVLRAWHTGRHLLYLAYLWLINVNIMFSAFFTCRIAIWWKKICSMLRSFYIVFLLFKVQEKIEIFLQRGQFCSWPRTVL